MSHFNVLVIGTPESVEGQLAPYSEHIEVPPYIQSTPQQQIERLREHIALGMGSREKYLAGEPPYDNGRNANPSHIEYLFTEVPLWDKMTDEDLWEQVILQDGEERDDHGNIWETYNPRSKWDYHRVGGRWANALKLRDDASEDDYTKPQSDWDSPKPGEMEGRTAQARLRAIDLDAQNFGFYALVRDGEWQARGEMGWFGMSADREDLTPEQWADYCNGLVRGLEPHTWVTVVDCHI